ncbi:MAG: multifunctional CCA addition/repair protein [Burkholderiales bacterium]|jgi:tRNA nucleotidyltransferase (CCA-adding enzyme)|nr:multifunctional CCA addition/repair protein [Burkholderiales bacterium]
MKAYVVGGAVRDALLGRPNADQDWVVVGASPEEMVQAGFTAVGRDFPVFLHPTSKQEYALARTERKTAPGYRGFTFHADPAVTLEQDLARRDLTVNAMAFDEDGTLIDPHGGRHDLDARLLRHVSPAFAEDPVRILRLARFAARLHDFSVAPQTMVLARRMVDAGEADALVPERVWQEVARGLMEARPSRMLQVLRDTGALARLMPEVDCLWGAAPTQHEPPAQRLLRVLDISAGLGCTLPQRFACLGHAIEAGRASTVVDSSAPAGSGTDLPKLEALCRRLRVPAPCHELARLVAHEFPAVERCESMAATDLLHLLERCDALRRPERFDAMLLACECIALGAHAMPQPAPAQRARLQLGLRHALQVDTRRIAAHAVAQGLTGPAIGQAIHDARLEAISAGLGWGQDGVT